MVELEIVFFMLIAMVRGVWSMSTNNSGILTVVLKALLDGKTINRKDYNNGSLHSWISSLRNERYIPIETDMKNSDGTCDYYMLPEEIVRFREPELRKKQEAEMRLIVERERQQNFIDQFLEFLKCLIEYPSLWGYWDELSFRLDEIAREINALLSHEESVNQ